MKKYQGLGFKKKIWVSGVWVNILDFELQILMKLQSLEEQKCASNASNFKSAANLDFSNFKLIEKTLISQKATHP